MNDQPSNEIVINLGPLHEGQLKAYEALGSSKLKVLRCGRRFGKTELAKIWLASAALAGNPCAWFAPQHKMSAEVFTELVELLRPLVEKASRSGGYIRLRNGGRIDFWSLEKFTAGRGRGYKRIVVDEAAFTKGGDSSVPGSMMSIWEKSIKPTLLDHDGDALVCSNSAGKDPDNFLYMICNDPNYGFLEYHAPTTENPLLPKRLVGESAPDWRLRRKALMDGLQNDNAPLVYAQEYLAEFVDWSGEAFFATDRLLEQGLPVPYPKHCDCVYAIIDTASKTGTDNDSTAVTFFARDQYGPFPSLILDWDVVQIEGAMLVTWLPTVFQRLEDFARQCQARAGSIGAFIEDKGSGTVLLQQARNRGWPAEAIDSKLTSLGKDERAISVSGYVYCGKVKYTDQAFNKVKVHKQRSMNHLVNQIESFRVGDKDSRREDDLIDTFCYGIALGLGDSEGF